MRRLLLRTEPFERFLKKRLKGQPQLRDSVADTLQALSNDAFDPTLKTHKLHGNLAGYWACNVSYEWRVIFEFVQHDGSEAILLHNFGTHDQVY